MTVLIYILLGTFLISLLAFVGALTLFLRKDFLDKIILILVALSAGALIGGAFLHLIPETVVKIGADENKLMIAFLYLILGFCVFFILEQFIRWHHRHGSRDDRIMPFSYLILVSDGIHNFIDGLIIAASFAVTPSLGVITTLAVALHEIPQEIGDYGVLVYGGFKRVKALFLNFLSAMTVVLGGVIGFLISEQIGKSIIFLLPFAAGNFIYIAASDLIPEIKHKISFKKSLIHFFIFLLGIILMLVIKVV